MIKTINICDKCKKEIQNNNCYWADKIINIKVYCPPDGINGGLHDYDMCGECRTKLNNLLLDFFKVKNEPR